MQNKIMTHRDLNLFESYYIGYLKFDIKSDRFNFVYNDFNSYIIYDTQNKVYYEVYRVSNNINQHVTYKKIKKCIICNCIMGSMNTMHACNRCKKEKYIKGENYETNNCIKR